MKGDRFGIRMSGIAADLVLKTGGEISRMRIGADKIGRPETKNIAGKSEALPCRNRTGFRRFLDGPIRVLSRNGLAIARTGRVLSVPDRGAFPRGLRAVGIYAARIVRPTEI